MARIFSTRTYGNPPIPTRTRVDTDTGVSTIFIRLNGEYKEAASGTADGNWNLTSRFRREYNRTNGDNLSDSEFQDFFAENYQRTADRDRGKIIDLNASDSVRRQLSNSGLPFVTSPDSTTGVPDETADQSQTSAFRTPNAALDQPSGALYYPEALITEQAALKIEILEYKPGGLGSGSIYGGRSTESVGNSIVSIYLPIPQGARDTNTAGWSKGDLTALDAAVADLTLQGIEGGADQVLDTARGLVNSIGKNGEDAKKLVTTLVAGAATGLGKKALQRRDGAIINPNSELLFNNPDLRQFNFNYTLSPRTSREARMVVEIIRALKSNMAPRRSSGTLFLLSPNLYRLSYVIGRGAGENPYLNKFKLCALTSLSTDYAANGTYMSFDDDIPVRYDLTLNFQEIVPVYQEDYANSQGVGY